jgi:spore germination protein YaaH
MFTFTSRLGALLLVVALIGIPVGHASANHDLEVAGWIPYWRDSQGMKDAKTHLSLIDTVYPFAFTVDADGSIKDQAGLTKKDWKSFTKTAQGKDVEVIPTIMSGDGAAMHAILSNTSSRKAHVKAIATMVEKGKYDGVDIDYEAKRAETKNFFSLFLLELKQALGKDKVLSCTVEARTPPDSLYREVPEVVNYTNDYSALDLACDRIVIMAYDQQRADIKANDARKGLPYIPVADPLWVEKVVKLALEHFDEEKIVLGIPTYGRQWAVTVAPDWFKGYESLEALNIPHMLDLAKREKMTPTRNIAGEMSFSYLPQRVDSATQKAIKKMKVPSGTAKGDKIALQALAYANKTGKEVIVNVAWYSDAGAMIDKIQMAEKYGLRGVSFFKIDGEEDQKVWAYLKEEQEEKED